MKHILHTLMITAAVTTLALPAHAATVTKQTVIHETGAARDPALVEAAKNRMTRDLQAELASRGYKVDVNGAYDAKTAEAVRAFQRDNNQPVTGEASAQLLAALGVDTSLGPTQVIEEHQILKYKLANKGSENSNVYDDPRADRTGAPQFKQRYKKLTTTEVAPDVTTRETTTVFTVPAHNR